MKTPHTVNNPPRSHSHRLAVLGSPISHSRSPQLHAAAYRQLGLPWEYGAIEVAEADLETFVEVRDESWRGFSLTMPLKKELVRLAATVDDVVTLTGVGNTLFLAGGERAVFNTDVAGLARAIGEAGIVEPTHIVIIGSGATAASAVVAAARLNARRVSVVARNTSSAEALTRLGERAGIAVSAHPFEFLRDSVEADLVISTLPGGTTLDVEISAELRNATPLFDAAYDPWPSSLARAWAAAGGTAIAGSGMLLHQALVQVRIFVNGSPDAVLPGESDVLEAMRATMAPSIVKD